MTLIFSAPAFAAEKPNILAIFGGDIGWFDPSSYNHGMMGYQTPNIDRITEGDIMFTDVFTENASDLRRLTKGEAVVLYREPSTTQEMWYPRLSRRVNKMAIFSCF